MATEFITGSVFIAENTTGTSVIASGAINQSGTLYSIIVPSASGAPNVQQVIDGQDSASGALAANFVDNEVNTGSGTYVSLSGYGLTSETSYTIYVAASGNTDGLIASVSGVNFTTPDITAPTWRFSYPLLLTNTAGTSVNYGVGVTEDNCSGWYLTLASGSIEPTASAIKSSGVAFDMASSGLVYSITETGLTSETAYSTYFVAQDDDNNLQSSGYVVTYLTPDITAPSFSAGYPTVSSITTSTATTTLKMNDAGSGFFIIVPTASASTPSAAQIRAGTDASDTAIATGLKGNNVLVANTAASMSITNLQYSTNYTIYWVGRDDGGNDTAVSTATFRAAVPAPGVPGRYSMRRMVERRRRLGNQIINTLRGM